jgi:hypothetical protein
MARRSVIIAAALSMSAIAGCSYLPDLGLTEDEAPVAVAALPPKVPVQRIESLELGRLFNGYMLTAVAIAPGTGYYQPELALRYGGELGPDGFYEYDFVARAPEEQQAGATTPITARYLRADSELTPEMLRSARGVRIWSARDSVEGRF